jgi:hypothetical protein
MEAVGQDVLDEASQEYHRMQRGRPMPFGAEGDVLRAHVDQAGIGNADAVGVSA